jgi:transposase
MITMTNRPMPQSDWPTDRRATSAAETRRRYPSDLSERQWDLVSGLLTKSEPTVGRPRQYPLRDVVDAVNYRWETGCVWRMLPHDFPPWATVYRYFRYWQRRGLLAPLRAAALHRGRVRSGHLHGANVTESQPAGIPLGDGIAAATDRVTHSAPHD